MWVKAIYYIPAYFTVLACILVCLSMTMSSLPLRVCVLGGIIQKSACLFGLDHNDQQLTTLKTVVRLLCLPAASVQIILLLR